MDTLTGNCAHSTSAFGKAGAWKQPAVGEGEMLTPVPGDAPRINGPRIYGARPDKEFVFRIACQGRRPIQFEVEGLSGGLKLDAERGVIRGRTPDRKGNYDMTLRAESAHGLDASPFRLVVGDKLEQP